MPITGKFSTTGNSTGATKNLVLGAQYANEIVNGPTGNKLSQSVYRLIDGAVVVLCHLGATLKYAIKVTAKRLLDVINIAELAITLCSWLISEGLATLERVSNHWRWTWRILFFVVGFCCIASLLVGSGVVLHDASLQTSQGIGYQQGFGTGIRDGYQRGYTAGIKQGERQGFDRGANYVCSERYSWQSCSLSR